MGREIFILPTFPLGQTTLGMGSCLCMSHPDPKNFYCHSETACLQKGLIYPRSCTKLRCNLKTASDWGFSALGSKTSKVCVSGQGGRCQSCSYLESQLHSCPVNHQVTPDQASAARKTQQSPAKSMGTYWFSAWILLWLEKRLENQECWIKAIQQGRRSGL